jgi:hypothetical protein
VDQGLRRRRQRWVPVWGWAHLAVGVLGVLAVGDICLHNGALARQLLDEDVDSGGVFKSGRSVSNHIDYKIMGGTYATTSLTDHPSATARWRALLMWSMPLSMRSAFPEPNPCSPVSRAPILPDNAGYLLIADMSGSGACTWPTGRSRSSRWQSPRRSQSGHCANRTSTLTRPHPPEALSTPRPYSTANRCSPPAKKGALSRYTAVVLLMGATHKGVRVHFDNLKAIVPE